MNRKSETRQKTKLNKNEKMNYKKVRNEMLKF